MFNLNTKIFEGFEIKVEEHSVVLVYITTVKRYSVYYFVPLILLCTIFLLFFYFFVSTRKIQIFILLTF
jgi:hypothetical protein